VKYWLTVEEAAPLLGETPDAIYRAIREGEFPWEFVRIGRRIKISAKSIGLISSLSDLIRPQRGLQNSEAEPQGKTFAEAA
jgi:excisionase family DNA binding protein